MGTPLKRGFLGNAIQSARFAPQSSLHQELNLILDHFPALIKNRELRTSIDYLDTIQRDTVEMNHQQENDALFALLMLTQAYIWEEAAAPRPVVPSVLAAPLYRLCKSRQRFPMITYADYVLNNWRLKHSSEPVSLDNIEPILTFTGEPDEAWFIKIHVVIEATCGAAINAAFGIHDLLKSGHYEDASLLTLLLQISTSLQQATALLTQMKNGCRPAFYAETLRHFLSGWDKAGEHGVMLKGVSIRGKTPSYQYRGPSGAQSSVIPALDAILGIKHEIDDMYQLLLNFQQYMPDQHVATIKLFHQHDLRQIIESQASACVKLAWEQAVEEVAAFRVGHMNLIREYIYQTAGQTSHQKITGTGGAPIEEYLGGRSEDTRIIDHQVL